MKILIVNSGSSSLKFQVNEMPDEQVLISGVFERIGMEGSFYTIKLNGEKIEKHVELKDHKKAFELIIEELMGNNIIDTLDDIGGVGHRGVQGGSYDRSVIISEDVIREMEKYSPLAPLHNPVGITGIRAAQEVIPNAKQVVVFDTSFHQTMPEENYLYALPYEWYEKYGVRRYGAHGTSHKYVSLKMNEILDRTDTKLITCHIGNGASISAVLNGKCLNTSMGLTPNAGLIMGSRCGDIDATILPYVMEQAGLTKEEVETALNKESGLLGISGVSSDSRDIDAGIKEGNKRCELAEKMYVRRIVDYIAKYYVELAGCDALVFTAGVGENSVSIRRQVIEALAVLGIKLDEDKNNIRGSIQKISTSDSSVKVYVIPTDEELMIARDTFELINS